MHSDPLVSVIIPIYNTAKYLPACLNSIINQTHKNLEIILINDGSTDNSSKIIKEYTKKDKRIIVVNQKNLGQSSARNTGLKKAKGDYISFVDSDDLISIHFVEKLLAAYNENTSVSVCGIHYKRLKSNSSKDVYVKQLRPRKINESFKAHVLYLLAIDGRIYSSTNKLYRANVAKKLRFDEKLNFAEDTKFVLDYLEKSQGEISFVLEPLYVYNYGTETSTMRSVSVNWQNWQTSYHNLKHWLGPHPTLREQFWLKIVHLRWCISYLRSRHRANN